MKPCGTPAYISPGVEFYPPTEILNIFVFNFLSHAF